MKKLFCVGALAVLTASCEERQLVVGAPDAAAGTGGAPGQPSRVEPMPPGPPIPTPDAAAPPRIEPPPPRMDAATAVLDTRGPLDSARVETMQPPPPPAATICGVSGDTPVRPLTISPELLAARLTKFLFNAAARKDTIDLVAASRDTRDLAEDMQALMMREPPLAFFHHWLDSSRLQRVTAPEITAEVRGALQSETDRLLARLLSTPPFRLHDLLNAPFAFATPALRSLYGAEATPPGRAGLLAHPSWLVTHPNPSVRGTWIRDHLFCEAVPPPPPNIDVAPPRPTDGLTNRERWSAAVNPPSCVGCHDLMDPQGFAFENFDDLGRYRTTDSGKPVDATGQVVKPPGGGTIRFANATDLMKQLAERCDVRTCFARQMLDFALDGRTPASKASSLREVTAVFLAAGSDVRRLMLAIIQSEAFIAP